MLNFAIGSVVQGEYLSLMYLQKNNKMLEKALLHFSFAWTILLCFCAKQNMFKQTTKKVK